MKFVVGNGKQLRKRLETFPESYKKRFLSFKLVVILVVNDNDAVGACGIAKVSNYVVVYVKEGYRRKGFGTKLEAKTFDVARKHGLDFLLEAIHLWNLPSLRLARKVGYREIVRFRDYGYTIMMAPFSLKGEVIYAFLCTVFSLLPRTLLHQLILVLWDAVKRVRRVAIAS